MATTKELYENILNKSITKHQLNKNYDSWNEESTVFTSNGKTLIFIGTRHSANKNKVKFIKNVIDKTKPDLVLVELPKNASEDKILSFIRQPEDGWKDVNWAIYFANEKSIQIRGMDIEDRFKPFTNAKEIGLSKEEGAKLGFLIFALAYMKNPNRTKAKELKNEDLFDLALFDIIQEFMVPSRRFYKYKPVFLSVIKKQKGRSIFESLKQTMERTMSEYASDKPLQTLLEDSINLSMPYPFSTKYRLNRMIAWWDSHRNLSMINSCIKALSEKDTVLAVAGWAHIYALRDTLKDEIEKNFGSVEMMSWNEFKNKRL